MLQVLQHLRVFGKVHDDVRKQVARGVAACLEHEGDDAKHLDLRERPAFWPCGDEGREERVLRSARFAASAGACLV